MKFAWDPAKANVNLRKHGVAFQDAALVFTDPNRAEGIDDGDYDEERIKVIGWAVQSLLVVVYTVGD